MILFGDKTQIGFFNYHPVLSDCALVIELVKDTTNRKWIDGFEVIVNKLVRTVTGVVPVNLRLDSPDMLDRFDFDVLLDDDAITEYSISMVSYVGNEDGFNILNSHFCFAFDGDTGEMTAIQILLNPATNPYFNDLRYGEAAEICGAANIFGKPGSPLVFVLDGEVAVAINAEGSKMDMLTYSNYTHAFAINDTEAATRACVERCLADSPNDVFSVLIQSGVLDGIHHSSTVHGFGLMNLLTMLKNCHAQDLDKPVNRISNYNRLLCDIFKETFGVGDNS